LAGSSLESRLPRDHAAAALYFALSVMRVLVQRLRTANEALPG
jgi:hypothetical protein